MALTKVTESIIDFDTLKVGTTATGGGGLVLSESINLTFSSDTTNSYANLFRQKSSAATVLAQGYKYSDTSNAFASSIGSSWAKTAISQNYGTIRFYTDAAATTAVGTDVTPTECMRIDTNAVHNGGMFRASGWYGTYNAFSSNQALETGTVGSYSYVLAYNRTASTYAGLMLSGDTVRFQTGGNQRLIVDDGATYPYTDDVYDLGTSAFRYDDDIPLVIPEINMF